MRRIGLTFKTILSRQWLLPTIVVVAGMFFLAQLGFWQLDRLEQRRVVNTELMNSLARESLVLPDAQVPEDIDLLKNRDVSVRGTFDFEYEGQLILQNWQSQPGIRLLTPLLIEGTETAVLVDRGWIPEAAIETQSQFQQQGTVTVDGYIALTQLPRTGGENAKSVRGEGEWYRVNVEAYETAVPYNLYPFYIVQEPDPNVELELPYKQELEVDLSEGSHLGYAIQWFMFSGMLGFAYISYVNIELRKKATI